MKNAAKLQPFLNGKSAPRHAHKPKPRSSMRKVVSLFSGCGGMDLGFMGGFKFHDRMYRRLPFEIVWANDVNERACATYQLNLKHKIYCGDIWNQLDTLPSRADVVIGGFPCQDVSINGLRKAERGQRTTLYKAMQEVIARTLPRVFVAENVKGILMAHSRELYKEMMDGFESLGYKVSKKNYLAADYGVPQMRERVFFVGIREGDPFEHLSPILSRQEWISAQNALEDLETEEECADSGHVWSRAKISPDQGHRILAPDRPGMTMRAESHGNNPFHYSLPRRLSLREMARLQSFPDDFSFLGGMRQTERQIGNAVPPVLAWHLAKAVMKEFRDEPRTV